MAAAVGAATGFVVGNEMLSEDLLTATILRDVDEVWDIAKRTLSELSDGPLEIQDFPRAITTRVDGARVTVEVHAYDLDRTIVTVEATEYLVHDAVVADRVMDTLVARMAD